MKFLTNLDLNKNELQNAILQPLATAPSNPVLGQIYYNSVDKLVYSYDGTTWKAVGAVLSVNGKAGVVTMTQDDVGNGVTYKQTHNDLTDALIELIDGALQTTGGAMTGNLAMGSNKITGLADGTNDQDAVTKKQLDAAALGAYKPKGSSVFANLPALSAAVLNNVYNVTDAFTTTADFAEGAGHSYPAGTNVAIINVGTDADPVYKYDALPGVIDLSPYLEKSGGTMTGVLNMGSNKITGLATPTADTDAVNKAYVDNAVAGGVHTATGTIATTATSVNVAYTGTLVNAYALMNGAFVQVDITVSATTVAFSTSAAPSASVTCVVVYA